MKPGDAPYFLRFAVSLTTRSACVQALEWIHDTGEFYLSTHTSTGSSIHHTQELLKEHEEFHITAKVGRVRARSRPLNQQLSLNDVFPAPYSKPRSE